jgi:hypothetical protein
VPNTPPTTSLGFGEFQHKLSETGYDSMGYDQCDRIQRLFYDVNIVAHV